MTTSVEETKYRCLDDCEFSGCPGHVMRLDYQSVSDYFSLYIDDKLVFSGDTNTLKTFLSLCRKTSSYRVEIGNIHENPELLNA